MWLFYLRNYLAGVNGGLSERLLPMAGLGLGAGGKQVHMLLWLLKIGSPPVCLHVAGPEISPFPHPLQTSPTGIPTWS